MRLLSDVSEEMCGQFPGRYDGLDTKGANVFVGHVQNINTAILRLFTITEKVTADILRYLATFPFLPYAKNMINKLWKLGWVGWDMLWMMRLGRRGPHILVIFFVVKCII